MKVFIAKPTAPYSGGCVIVAAQSIEEAQSIADDAMLWEKAEVSEMTDLQTLRTTPGVIVEELYFE